MARLERENFEREAAREAEKVRLEMEERLKREEEERLERKRRVEAIMSRTRKSGPETNKYGNKHTILQPSIKSELNWIPSMFRIIL